MAIIASADGTRIAFERAGRGPALILVGGAFCDHRARSAGTPLAAGLTSSFTVVCYDRRGRGESSDAPAYAVEREVEDLAALIGAVGGSAHVYGHSSGAVLAFEAALAGLRIHRLALYEPPLVLGDGRERIPDDLVEQLDALTAAGRRSDLAELFLTRAVGVPAAAVQGMKQGPAWPALESVAPTLRYDARLTIRPLEIVARAPRLATPALVLDGGKSPPWMRAGVAKLAEALPAARHVTLPEQTHDVDPKVLAPVLTDFFAS